MSGATGTKIEAKLIEHSKNGESAASNPGGHSYAPHIDLSSLISRAGCECLNESDDHPLRNCIDAAKVDDFLESDCDEQLIITLAFNQPIKLHSLKIQADASHGPKTLKVFKNQPNSLDFDRADKCEPVQCLDLKPGDLTENAAPILLKYVKFQNVNSLTIFVKDNQTGSDTTRIHKIIPIGSPAAATNMNDFKRIGGKQGEAH